MSKGVLTVISGFSGAGKGTIMKELIQRYQYFVSISATTRQPRAGEEHGREYYFYDREQFESMIANDQLIEWAEYVGNYYGTPKGSIREKLNEGIDVILEIEIEGASNIKKLVPEAIFIFILPPSLKTMVKRLKKRGTDSKEKIMERFHTAYKEINEVTKYNYVVVNDILEDAIDKVDAIIKAEKCRVDRIEEVFVDTKEEEVHELLMEDDKEFENENIAEKID
ncbi:MAG: guanylate kinase [Candidatus Faecimonas sp.]|nr:guanylate kinase [Candidatus Faecimonas sp.]